MEIYSKHRVILRANIHPDLQNMATLSSPYFLLRRLSLMHALGMYYTVNASVSNLQMTLKSIALIKLKETLI